MRDTYIQKIMLLKIIVLMMIINLLRNYLK